MSVKENLIAAKALDQLEAIIHELAGEVAPGGPEDRAWAIINDLRSSLHPSPDIGKGHDEDGTWSDGGKEWTPEAVRKFNIGDRVTKAKGSSWTGHVVGFYRTSLTPIGYAIESENEPGSVQIYPESALDRPK